MAELFHERPLEPAVDIETIAGPLLLPRADHVITPALSRWRVWEPAETRYLRSILRAGDTFVDVGAHVGYFSVLAAKLVRSRGAVIAVEPEARNLDLLRRNLARNGCHTARVIPFAAGASNRAMSLALDEQNRGGHRLVERRDGDADVHVRCVCLDDVLPTKVDVIKIDAQGYDHEVIAGLRRTIAANPRLIVIAEFSRDELERRGLDLDAVLARYEAPNFVFRMFAASGELRRVSAAEVIASSQSPNASPGVSLVLERAPTPPFGLNSQPTAADRLEVNRTADGVIVLDPVRGRAHQLNQTAAVVFELCTGKHSIALIVQLIQEMYELPAPPTDEVEQCLDHLRREGIVS